MNGEGKARRRGRRGAGENAGGGAALLLFRGESCSMMRSMMVSFSDRGTVAARGRFMKDDDSAETTARCEALLRAWRERRGTLAQAQARRMDELFTAWRPQDDEAPQRERCGNLLHKTRELQRQASRSGELVSVWDITRRHNEMHYSAALAWILDAQADHGQGGVFLRELLGLVRTMFPDDEDARSLPLHERYEVFTEWPLGRSGRADLFLRSASADVIMEVKTYAPEHGEQLKSYRQWLEGRKKAGRRGACLFLTPEARAGQSSRVLPLSWKQTGMTLLGVLSRLGQEHPRFQNSMADRIIRQFCLRVIKL